MAAQEDPELISPQRHVQSTVPERTTLKKIRRSAEQGYRGATTKAERERHMETGRRGTHSLAQPLQQEGHREHAPPPRGPGDPTRRLSPHQV